MTRPMLALEAHPDSWWEWQKYRARTTVTGPWEAFERATEAAITEEIGDILFLAPFGGEEWSIVCGEADALYLAPFVDREAWAKVRITVSVEVLDGVL